MTSYTTSCPHCKLPISIQPGQKRSRGCPQRKCPFCKHMYIDPHCYEEALKPFKKTSKAAYAFGSLLICAGVLWFPILLFFVYSGLSAAIKAGICLVLISCVFAIVFSRFLSVREESAAEALRRWQCSDARLRNPQYAKMLAEAGFKVPKMYLTDAESDIDTCPDK